MNVCIKTGARVYMPEYHIIAPADLFQIADCIIVRFNGNPKKLTNYIDHCPAETTHIVVTNPPDTTWCRWDLGIVAVPKGFVRKVRS